MAVQPEWFGAFGQEDLTIFGAFGDQGIGADEAFVSHDHVVAHGGVHGEEAVFPYRDYAGDVRAGGKPAVIADRAVVSNHRAAPNENVVSEPNARVDEDIVHDEAILAILAVCGQA